MTKSQEQFEKWVESDIDRMITMQCPIYRSVALSAWQAARDSIEVELPTQDEYDDPLSVYNAISDCKKNPPHCRYSNQGRE